MTAEDDLLAAQEGLDAAQEALAGAVRTRDRAIRAARSEGIPASRVAAILGVDRQIVYRIQRRE